MNKSLRREFFEHIHDFRFKDRCTVSALAEQLLLLVNSRIDDIFLNHDKPVDMTLIKKIKEDLK